MIEKLLKIQRELKVPKNNRNTFGNYNYRSCEDILEAVKPLCHREGMLLNISDTMVEVGGRVYVKARAEVSDGEKIIFADGWAREAETKKGMDEAQITGSASSYARKYALNGLFAIDDTKDADATNDHGKATMSTEEAWAKLSEAGTLDELTKTFKSLPAVLQRDAEVIAKATELKNKLA